MMMMMMMMMKSGMALLIALALFENSVDQISFP